MTTFVLVPGAGGQAWYWHRVTPLLAAAGHEGVAVELPADDASAGLDAYAEAIVAAAGAARGAVLVAQSMGGFSAPLACGPLEASGIVLVNAMIPRPGETAGEWWENTGSSAAAAAKATQDGRDPDADFDPLEVFFHDVPGDVVRDAFSRPPVQADRPFEDPWPLDAWPDLPTRALASADDRLFPAEFQRRVAEDRLGITPETLPGGHLAALARPEELVAALLR